MFLEARVKRSLDMVGIVFLFAGAVLSGSRTDRFGDGVCCLPVATAFSDLTSIIAPMGPSADHFLYRRLF